MMTTPSPVCNTMDGLSVTATSSPASRSKASTRLASPSKRESAARCHRGHDGTRLHLQGGCQGRLHALYSKDTLEEPIPDLRRIVLDVVGGGETQDHFERGPRRRQNRGGGDGLDASCSGTGGDCGAVGGGGVEGSAVGEGGGVGAIDRGDGGGNGTGAEGEPAGGSGANAGNSGGTAGGSDGGVCVVHGGAMGTGASGNGGDGAGAGGNGA
eukprot:scaffold20892_cov112-Isochrysis_galbana.AAC.1